MKKNSLYILVGFLLAILSACQLSPQPAHSPAVASALPTETAEIADDISPFPDLVVSYVSIAMQGSPLDTTECVLEYTPYEIRAIIENRGKAPATNVQVSELSTAYTLQIGELLGGQKVEVIIPLDSPNGAYRIRVDPQNLIPESDEDNNTAEYTAVTPTPPVLCQSTPPVQTPQPGSPTMSIQWNTYQDDLYGFSFEYPLVYEEPAYINRCGLKINEGGVHLGQRIDLQVFDPGDLGLEDFANNLLQDKGWNVDLYTRQLISGLEGINIQYRFGGTNRFGTISLVEHNDQIFAFNFSAGSFCDISKNQTQISEGAVYEHLLESFLFNK